MAKHAVFALTFMAIIAFSAVSAYKTTIVTTIIEGNKWTWWPYDGLDNGRGVVDALGPDNGQHFVHGLDNGSGQGLVDGLDNGSGQGLADGLDNGSGQRLADGLNNPTSSQQCRSEIPMEQLNHCKMHLTQGIIFDKMSVRPLKHHQEQHLQQCCSQLKQICEKCQCAAIQQVFNKAWQQEGGLQKVSQIASEAYKLPNACGLKVQGCQLKVPRV